MKVLLASSEIVPFAKTGGLADVTGSLPKALRGIGVEADIVLPLYRQVDRERFPTFDDRLREAMFEEPIHFLVDGLQTFEAYYAALRKVGRVVVSSYVVAVSPPQK